MRCDQVADMISDGIQKIIIVTDSQAALNRIHHTEPGYDDKWASAIIRCTKVICRQISQVKVHWVPRYVGIDSNETAY
jgi:ribonuclease HI